MSKKACKSDSAESKNESAKYKCKKCGALSEKKDHLCKPEKEKR